MLTRVLPFNAENPTSIMYRIVHEQPPDPREANGLIPEDACAVLLKGLNKDPEERYANCTEFADALRAALGGAPMPAAVRGTVAYGPGTLTHAPETSVPAVTGSGSNRWMGYAAVILALAIVALIVWSTGILDRDPSGGEFANTSGGTQGGGGDQAGGAGNAAGGEEATGGGSTANTGGAETGATGGNTETGGGGETQEDTGGTDTEDPEVVVILPPPEPLLIDVFSDPEGATVILDGTPQPGITPLQLELMPDQRYVVGVQLFGYEPQSVQNIDPSTLAPPELNFPNLIRDTPPGIIDFSGADYAYTIEVDGTARAPDAVTRQLQLPEGAYSVIVSASEVFYGPQTRQIDLSREQTVLWSFPPAYMIRMLAPGLDTCLGLVDGTEIGILPMDIRVAGGVHMFRFECETRGNSEQERNINRTDQRIER